MTSCDSSDCWLGALICFLQSSLGTNPHIYNSICPFAFSLSLLQPFSCPLSEPWPLCPFGDSFLGLVEQSGLPSNYIRPFTGGGVQTWEVPAWRHSLSLRLSRCSLLTPYDSQRSSSQSSSEAGQRGQISLNDKTEQKIGERWKSWSPDGSRNQTAMFGFYEA